jgi:hypothetical protein
MTSATIKFAVSLDVENIKRETGHVTACDKLTRDLSIIHFT